MLDIRPLHLPCQLVDHNAAPLPVDRILDHTQHLLPLLPHLVQQAPRLDERRRGRVRMDRVDEPNGFHQLIRVHGDHDPGRPRADRFALPRQWNAVDALPPYRQPLHHPY